MHAPGGTRDFAFSHMDLDLELRPSAHAVCVGTCVRACDGPVVASEHKGLQDRGTD